LQLQKAIKTGKPLSRTFTGQIYLCLPVELEFIVYFLHFMHTAMHDVTRFEECVLSEKKKKWCKSTQGLFPCPGLPAIPLEYPR